jgi:hypothetical protein
MKKLVSFIGWAVIILMAYISVMFIVAPATLDAQSSYFWTLKVRNHLALGDDQIVGDDAFTTTALIDTVVIDGTLSTDLFFISLEDTNGAGGAGGSGVSISANAGANGDTLFVKRGFGGKSAAGYQWVRIRPY